MIPKIIHHIWTSSEPMSARFLLNIYSWRDKHRDWEHFLWTSGRLPQLRNAQIFRQAGCDVERREIVRAEVLAQFGGVCPDGSCECVQAFDHPIRTLDAFAIRSRDERWVFGSTKEHVLGRTAARLLMRLMCARAQSGSSADCLASYYDELMAPGFSNLLRPELEERTAWHGPEEKAAAALYEPESVLIVVKTVHREPEYIHHTLASMFAADDGVRRTGEVFLLVGNDNWGYLKDYLHHENIRVVPMSPKELKRLAGLDRAKSKAALNRCRSLRVPLSGKAGVLIVEDDVVFRDRFLARLLATVREMECNYGLRDYALALFAPYDFEAIGGTPVGRRFCEYTGDPFVCTQGMYYPAHVTAAIADEVERRSLESYEDGGDVVVGECMKGKIYATPRFLVQHIGAVSTGLGGTTMDQSVFCRPYTLLHPENGLENSASLYSTPTVMCLAGGNRADADRDCSPKEKRSSDE